MREDATDIKIVKKIQSTKFKTPCNILYKNNILTLKFKIKKMFDLLELKWLGNIEVNLLKGSLCEIISFDFANGDTYIKLKQGKKIIFQRLLTGKQLISDIEPIGCFINNKNDMNKLIDIYEIITEKLQIKKQNIDFNMFLLLTKFIGYDENFYYSIPVCIPLSKNTLIQQSFEETARKLHLAKDIPIIYNNSSLPEIKSVKRIIFDSPELLFYQNELERFSNYIKDPYLFCKLIKYSNIHRILGYFHMYNKAFDYFELLLKIKTIKQILNLLANDEFRCFKMDVNYYCKLDGYQKRMFEKNLKSKKLIKEYYKNLEYSQPITIPKNFKAKNCKINGYEFKVLKTTQECETTRQKLNNYTIHYETNNNPIVVMLKDGKYIAAIEIENNETKQVYCKNYLNICDDDNAYTAYREWKRYCKLLTFL